MTLIDKIIKYEDGCLSSDEVVELFSELVKSRMIHYLQGYYVNNADCLIRSGYLSADGDILKYYQGDN